MLNCHMQPAVNLTTHDDPTYCTQGKTDSRDRSTSNKILLVNTSGSNVYILWAALKTRSYIIDTLVKRTQKLLNQHHATMLKYFVFQHFVQDHHTQQRAFARNVEILLIFFR